MDADELTGGAAPESGRGRPTAPGARGSMTLRWVPALTHGRYRVYWAGMLFSGGANRMFQLTAAWMVYEMATPPLNTAFMLGVLGFCRTIPMLAFALVGGVAADWVGRRRMLLITTSALAAVTGAFALLTVAGLVNVWLVLVAALLVGTAMAFNGPSHQAFVRDLVTGADVQNAVALMALMQTVLRIGAPLLAGGLLAGGGAGVTLALIVAGHATMGSLLTLIDVPRTVAAHTSMVSGVTEVFRYVRAERLVMALLLVATIPGLLALPYVTVLPIFADGVYGRGAGGLGVMEAMVGVGALTGAALLTMLSRFRQRGLLLITAIGAFGCALVVFALVDVWPLALVMLVVVGLSDTLYFFTINGLLLARAPDRLRGRVMSLLMLADIGMSPLGSIMMGAIAGGVGAQAALAVSGSATVSFIVGVAARFPRVRRA